MVRPGRHDPTCRTTPNDAPTIDVRYRVTEGRLVGLFWGVKGSILGWVRELLELGLMTLPRSGPWGLRGGWDSRGFEGRTS